MNVRPPLVCLALLSGCGPDPTPCGKIGEPISETAEFAGMPISDLLDSARDREFTLEWDESDSSPLVASDFPARGSWTFTGEDNLRTLEPNPSDCRAGLYAGGQLVVSLGEFSFETRTDLVFREEDGRRPWVPYGDGDIDGPTSIEDAVRAWVLEERPAIDDYEVVRRFGRFKKSGAVPHDQFLEIWLEERWYSDGELAAKTWFKAGVGTVTFD